MYYKFKTNSGNAFPITSGNWTETGNATGVIWDGFNLAVSPMIPYGVSSAFASGNSLLLCEAKTIPYVSGQLVSGGFIGCFPIGVNTSSFPRSFGIKLIVNSVTTGVESTVIGQHYSGNIGFTSYDYFGHMFSGSYSGMSMTGNFCLSCQVGLTNNYPLGSGTAHMVLGDSAHYEAGNGATSGYAWFMDGNNLSGIPTSGASLVWSYYDLSGANPVTGFVNG
jgi:hypothetical protein